MVMLESLVYTIPEEIINKFGSLVLVIQALGWAIIIYIVFNIVNAIINRKRKNELKKVNENLEEIQRILKRKK